MSSRSTTDPVCAYCGTPLKPKTMWVEFMGRDVQVGWVPCGCEGAKAKEAEDEKARAREDAMRHERLLAQAGVPERYWGATYTDRYKQAADHYVRHVLSHHNVVMCGPVGTGKTMLACHIASEAVKAGRSVRFTTSTGMLEDVRSSYDAGWSERSITSKYIKPDVLVLDDLGQERATEWALEILFHIVNERNAHMRPTVATMQTDPSEVMARYAKHDKVKAYALLSRLTATAEGAQIVDFQGGDRRVKVDHA